ncbi:hypothetical protein [Jatrophihabitans sp.]|uniref:hypothetical protein n=1 Tax=Jatrophihabitans sp. TaxID=1932789 RepID=UPI002EF6331D
MVEFELGLEEGGLQPLQAFAIELAVEQSIGRRAGDAVVAIEGGFVLADPGVRGPLRTAEAYRACG